MGVGQGRDRSSLGGSSLPELPAGAEAGDPCSGLFSALTLCVSSDVLLTPWAQEPLLCKENVCLGGF